MVAKNKFRQWRHDNWLTLEEVADLVNAKIGNRKTVRASTIWRYMNDSVDTVPNEYRKKIIEKITKGAVKIGEWR